MPVVICRATWFCAIPANRGACRAASVSTTTSTPRTCAISLSSAPVRRAGRRGLRAPRRASTCSCSRARARRTAGSSSKIENYLGFPTGISGQELAGRAYPQAQKFGAQLMIPREAPRARPATATRTASSPTGLAVHARTVIVATGADYPKLPLDLPPVRLEGAGVSYRATLMEAQLCDGEDVTVVGGGNSAGQAAVFLADTAGRVHMLVRSAGPRRHHVALPGPPPRGDPRIELMPCTEIVGLEGDSHLEGLGWRDCAHRRAASPGIRHLFVMPARRRHRLARRLPRARRRGSSDRGRPAHDELAAARWPLARAPHLLETSLPGVFAVGDVAAGTEARGVGGGRRIDCGVLRPPRARRGLKSSAPHLKIFFFFFFF